MKKGVVYLTSMYSLPSLIAVLEKFGGNQGNIQIYFNHIENQSELYYYMTVM